MKNINIIVIIVVCLSTIACVRETATCHTKLHIDNNSNKDIYWIEESYSAKDTILSKTYKITDREKINKSGTGYLYLTYCIESTVNKQPEQKLYLTLLDAAVVESTPWDTICKKDMVLKRYKLSVADLMRMDFTVTYP